MLLTVNQVIAIEIAILNIYLCYKDTRRGNVTKGKERKGRKRETQWAQESRGNISKTKQNKTKQNKKWTEDRKIKNKPESYHFEKLDWEQNQKATLLNNQVKRN